MKAVAAPTPAIQPLTAAATNSGPWSERTCAGTPRRMNRSDKTSTTSVAPSFRATRMARHSRVNSSTTQSMRNLRPSRVRSSTKSYAHTWLGRSGRSRTQEPSFSHKRPRLGCRGGTFRPSRRQIRSTRLRLTAQPTWRSSAVTRRYPYRPNRFASSMMSAVSRASSSGIRGAFRCVDRCCPSTAQALRSDTPRRRATRSTQARRRPGLTIFPRRPPSG